MNDQELINVYESEVAKEKARSDYKAYKVKKNNAKAFYYRLAGLVFLFVAIFYLFSMLRSFVN